MKLGIIELSRAEGVRSKYVATSFLEANTQLYKWSRTAPDVGYDKVDFKITTEENFSYTGVFHLTSNNSNPVDMLQRHLIAHSNRNIKECKSKNEKHCERLSSCLSWLEFFKQH